MKKDLHAFFFQMFNVILPTYNTLCYLLINSSLPATPIKRATLEISVRLKSDEAVP